MAFVMHLGCTSKGLVDYPWSTCLSAGAATPLNFGAASRRRFLEDFAQFITGTPSLTYIWPCLGACHANFALALSDSTQPPADAVPAWLTVESANGTRSASRTPLRKHPQVPLMPAERCHHLSCPNPRVVRPAVVLFVGRFPVVRLHTSRVRSPRTCTWTPPPARSPARTAPPPPHPLPRAQRSLHTALRTLLCAAAVSAATASAAAACAAASTTVAAAATVPAAAAAARVRRHAYRHVYGHVYRHVYRSGRCSGTPL